MKICKDGRIWGQNNKEAGSHLGSMKTEAGVKERRKRYYQEHKKKFNLISHEYWERYKDERKVNFHLTQRKKEKRLKVKVLTHYGNGKFACVKCGENHFPCLSLDHIGRKKAGEERLHGGKLYRFLRKEGYPEGYQTLCMNCQWIKRYNNREFNLR